MNRLALVCVLLAVPACTSKSAVITLHEENDYFSIGESTDRYYTQGARISATAALEETPEIPRAVAEALPTDADADETSVGVLLGQSIYTPARIGRTRPQRQDRPWAGWLYTGVVVSSARFGADGPEGDTVETVELQVGVVGPSSLADKTQTRWHEIIHVRRPLGWDNQLDDEPGAVLAYGRRWRTLAGDALGGLQWDVITGVGAAAGNVRVQANGSAAFRIGSRLPRDFGVNTIDHTAVEVGKAHPVDGWSWHVFGAVDGAAKAHDIFLDGNTGDDTPSVDRVPFVGTVRGGIAIDIDGFRFSWTQAARSREFHGQDGSQSFGSFGLSYAFEF